MVAALDAALARTPAERRELTRESQREFIDQLVKKTGLSLRGLAQGAGFSSSTLTRFMNEPDHDGLLSTHTLQKLYDKYHVQWHAPSMVEEEPERLPMVPDGVLKSLKALGPEARLHRQRDKTMEGRGLFQGDVAVVNESVKPAAGDLVLAEVAHQGAQRAYRTVRLYMPPFLVTTPLDPRLTDDLRPLTVDEVTVKILGVVSGIVRWF